MKEIAVFSRAPDGDAPALAPHQAEGVRWVESRLKIHPGVLIADAVGLGKSWIAAEVASRVEARGGRVEVIAPAALIAMWRELLSRFAVDAAVFSHEILRRRAPRPSGVDLVIVDEAHRFRNRATKGWRGLARYLVGSRSLFLTATPIWNEEDDLLALLEMLLPDDALRVAGICSIAGALTDERGRKHVLGEVVLRRDYTSAGLARPSGSRRELVLDYEVSDEMSAIEEGLGQLQFPELSGVSPALLRLVMQMRLQSSPAALAKSLARQRAFCRSCLDMGRRGFALDRRQFARTILQDELIQQPLFPEVFLEERVEAEDVDLDAIRSEILRLDRWIEAARRAADPKAEALVRELERRPLPTLVFTSAVETARTLGRMLRGVVRCGVATGESGGSGVRSLVALVERFQRGELDVLVMTDLGGEGLNLQRAGRVVHYDLPWSPCRVDQRNGRADRIGRSEASLEIVTLRPRSGELVPWEVIAAKAEVQQRFWAGAASLSSMSLATSTPRCPSRIPAGAPQVALWDRFPRLRDLLVRRYRAGIELLMSEESDEAVLREILLKEMRFMGS
jgi:superfamily II DNA or RNA helicase